MVRPNQSVYIRCITDRELSYQPTSALVQETGESQLPKCAEITPAIVQYTGKKQEIVVNVSNTTNNVLQISPKAIVGELQLVTLERENEEDTNRTPQDVLDQVNIDPDLTSEQHVKLM
ncbi:hypothetical protein DPMN_028624 [Dreissena polymorpha]|uniref:Uncharacterized protein n=1 Tax=Dreissena polymorpha TaxID=45954 RepID=A0A9D4LVR6_DREPO|nr:hypothetical protein DPMN_028624 [Dreissena polymorpha]